MQALASLPRGSHMDCALAFLCTMMFKMKSSPTHVTLCCVSKIQLHVSLWPKSFTGKAPLHAQHLA